MRVPASLVGCQVYQVKFDYQTALLLVGQDDIAGTAVSAWLTIHTPFVLRSRDSSICELDPETSRSALTPVIDLLFVAVAHVNVEGAGTLILGFTDGTTLTVPPHEAYESWELSGDGVPGILAGPGGEPGWTRE